MVLSKMEESITNARSAYKKMMAGGPKSTDGGDEGHHRAEIEELKLENVNLSAKVEDLQATKAWLLSEGARLLAKNIHRGPEMTAVMAAVNNTMSSVGVNLGLHKGYVHTLKKKTPFAEVPLLNRNAEADLNTTVACFDSLTFPVVDDLQKLINEPLSKINDTLLFFGVKE
ncbi:hypothetical protein Hanom_Chr16g01431101 [Helianthus anomalus]